MATIAEEAAPRPPAKPRIGAYAWYALFVLVLVYIVNFIDRQILSILVGDIKRDLDVTDAQIGFLYGTAFAVFYALFGIPLGRLADSWYRGRLMAMGLALWSSMTALVGLRHQLRHARRRADRRRHRRGQRLARRLFDDLRLASPRSGARPLSPSIRAASISAARSACRSAASCVSRWNAAYPDPATAPLGLAGWQAAFLAVGLPGLLLALWVLTLREPQRGASDGLPQPVVRPNAWRDFGRELVAILPPLTLFNVARIPGRAARQPDRARRRRRGRLRPLPAHRRRAAMGRLRPRRLCDLLLGPVAQASRPAGLRADLGLAGRGHARHRLRQHLVRHLCDQLLGAASMSSSTFYGGGAEPARYHRRADRQGGGRPHHRLVGAAISAAIGRDPRRLSSPTCGASATRAAGSSSTCSR